MKKCLCIFDLNKKLISKKKVLSQKYGHKKGLIDPAISSKTTCSKSTKIYENY